MRFILTALLFNYVFIYSARKGSLFVLKRRLHCNQSKRDMMISRCIQIITSAARKDVLFNLIKINSIGPCAQKKQASQIEPGNRRHNFLYFLWEFLARILKILALLIFLNLIKFRSRCPEKASSQIEPGNGRHNV